MSASLLASSPEELATTIRVGPIRAVQLSVPEVPGYELLGELGRGGMGVVYQARHIRLNRTVALKMILGAGHLDSDAAARFYREGEAVARLQHPNIIQVFEVGETAAGNLGSPVPFLAMEYVDGGTLASFLADRPQPAQPSARLVEVLGRAIHYAHQRGVLHRDLKPANVLLVRAADSQSVSPAELAPKIVDFGVAKRLDESADATNSCAIVGTPAYMAPEQAIPSSVRPKALGPATDVYALGAILYEMLTGRPPFLGTTPADTLLQIQICDPVPPRYLRPSLPIDIETICLKCLDREPTKRYATAADMSDDLARFLAGQPIIARPASAVEKVQKWVKRRPAIAGLTAALALTTLVGFAAIVWQWQGAVAARADAELRSVAEAEQRVLADAARDRAEGALYAGQIARARLEWQAGHTSATYEALDHCPPARRDWEWYYLDARRQGALWTLRHESPVHRIAFTPDGKTLAVASGMSSGLINGPGSDKVPGAIFLWDLATGKPRTNPLRRHAGPVREVCIAPNGSHMLSYSASGTAVLWKLPDGEAITEFAVLSDAFAFTLDGAQFVVDGPKNIVQVRDASTGTPLVSWDSTARVEGLDFSADGRQVLVALQGSTWQVRDAATGRQIRSLVGIPSGILSPDHSLMASMGGGAVQVWQMPALWDQAEGADGNEAPHSLYRLQTPEGAVQAVAFSPDGLALAVAGADTIVRVYDAPTGTGQVAFRGNTSAVNGLAFSPDGRFLAAAGEYSGRVLVWDRSLHPVYDTLAYVGGEIETIAFADGGKRVLALARDSVRLEARDAATGRLLGRQPLDFSDRWESPARRAEFSADGTRLAGVAASDVRLVHIWNTADTAKPTATLRGAEGWVYAVCLAQNGKRAAAVAMQKPSASPGEVLVWDAEGGVPIWRLAEPGLRTMAVTLSADGERIAFAGWKFDIKNGKVASGHAAISVRDLAAGHTTELIDPDDPQTTASPLGAGGKYMADIPATVAFSPNGRRVAVGSRMGRLRVWDLEPDGSSHLAWTAHLTRPAYAIAFTQDGKRLATNTRVQVQIWDAANGLEMLVLQAAPRSTGDPGFNPAIAFSPDGNQLLASQWDGTLSLHDAAMLKPERQAARVEAAIGRGADWHFAMREMAKRRGLTAAADFHAGRP